MTVSVDAALRGILESAIGKRAVPARLDDGTELALPLADIRRAKLLLTDALIAATAQAAKPN